MGDRAKIITIYPGIDLNFFKRNTDRKTLRIQYNIDQKDFVICCPARVAPRKRIEDLLFAIEKLNDSKIKVIITGLSRILRPNYHNYILDLIKKLRIKNNILLSDRMFGKEEMPRLYNLADLVILPSEEEGLGISLLEAMACFTPVVASNIEGVTEIVKDKKTGFLFNKGDVIQVASIIKNIKAGHIASLEKVRMNAYNMVMQNFNNNQQILKLIKAYKSVLSGDRLT